MCIANEYAPARHAFAPHLADASQQRVEGALVGEVQVGCATPEGRDLVAVVRADADWDELLRAVGALASNRQPVPPQGGHLRRDAVCLPHLAPVPPAARFGSVVWIGVDVLW